MKWIVIGQKTREKNATAETLYLGENATEAKDVLNQTHKGIVYKELYPLSMPQMRRVFEGEVAESVPVAGGSLGEGGSSDGANAGSFGSELESEPKEPEPVAVAAGVRKLPK